MNTTRRKSPSTRPSQTNRRWSNRVTQQSNALDLEPNVFTLSSPRRIALSLKRSAQASTRRKGTPYQSAMSMLNFYINRAGKNLPGKRKQVLQQAKEELRDVFGRS
jgi:Protein of unknown function (DUF3175)